MSGTPIRLARPDVGEDELAAVAAVLASGQLTMGPQVEAFERSLAIVALLLRDMGVAVPQRFGYAPSTPSPELAA